MENQLSITLGKRCIYYYGNFRHYAINTLRRQQMYENQQNSLYSTDQRTFYFNLIKRF